METLQIAVLLCLCILVLGVYYFFLIKDSTSDFISHPFWFDMPKDVIKFFIIFQMLAVVGFITAVTSLIQTPPEKGIMKGNMLFFTIALFLLSAAAWPIATYHNSQIGSVSSILLTALASILLLTGSIQEEENVKWYRVLGLLLLCSTTVLGDGVLWNVNYILKQKQKITTN